MTREDIKSFPGGGQGGPLRLLMTGISYCDGSYRISRLPSSLFVFEYVMEGKGYLEWGGRRHEPCAGDVYIVDGRKAHAYGSSAEEPWTKIWFNVEGPLVESIVELYGLSSLRLAKGCEELEEVFRRGHDAARAEPERADFHAAMAIHEIAARLSSRLGKEGAGSLEPPLAKAMDFIGARSSGPMPELAEICRAAGKSPSQTIRLFKTAFGTTPYAYCLDRRIGAAKLLLANSAKGLKEIASELGFADEFYFSNVFKRRTGSSPSEYRRGLRPEVKPRSRRR